MPSPPIVSLRNAGRRVGDRWVWRGLDIEIHSGDRLAVQGPSGAGKTLLLRAMAGLDALDEGTLAAELAHAEGVANLPRHRAAVAMVAQRAALFDGTVRDNLMAPFEYAVRGGEYSEAAARALLAALGRDAALLDQNAHDVSGGEAQTVGLARALLTAPSVLLLDEPTAGLDPDRTDAVETVVGDFLSAPGRAVVWTSHDAGQLSRVTDRSVQL